MVGESFLGYLGKYGNLGKQRNNCRKLRRDRSIEKGFFHRISVLVVEIRRDGENFHFWWQQMQGTHRRQSICIVELNSLYTERQSPINQLLNSRYTEPLQSPTRITNKPIICSVKKCCLVYAINWHTYDS